MPNVNDIAEEIQLIEKKGNAYDNVRRKYLLELHEVTGRNIVVYYSGWLQQSLKTPLPDSVQDVYNINDKDMNGFMNVFHSLKRSLGLDLILHTPGGDVAATEAIIKYIREMFNDDVRIFIPHLAMSGGTMIACCGKEIFMGKHSSIGPIDPQFYGLSVHGIKEQFETAKKELVSNPDTISYWSMIINKYGNPLIYEEAIKAMDLSKQICRYALETGMLKGSKAKVVDNIVDYLTSHSETLFHGRHIPIDEAKRIGLKVTPLESNNDLQDAVLNVHHVTSLTLERTHSVKILQNHSGGGYNLNIKMN